MAVIPWERRRGRKKVYLYPVFVPPLKPGTVVGEMIFLFKGEEVSAVDLIVTTRVEKDSWRLKLRRKLW